MQQATMEMPGPGVRPPAIVAIRGPIFSGGKVELKNLTELKFTLPPLGVGIKSLREALRLPPKVRRKKRRPEDLK
jgi:hypothetical protein